METVKVYELDHKIQVMPYDEVCESKSNHIDFEWSMLTPFLETFVVFIKMWKDKDEIYKNQDIS